MNSLPALLPSQVEESADRAQARFELRQATKWPEFREDDAERVITAVRTGMRPSAVYETAGYPSRRTIDVWRQLVPEFNAEFLAALEDRADELVEQGMEVVQDTGRDPSCRKVEADYCKWLAGALSARYRNKTGDSVTLTQVNVAGDVNISPADAYLSMIGG